MKNLSVFLLGLAVAASPAFIAIKTSPAATTLKMVTVDPSTSTNVSAVPIFLKLVEEKSAGRLKVDWIGGPEITPGKTQPAAVQKGVVDLSVAWAYVLHVPAFRVAHLSLLTPAEERKSGFYDFLVGEFEKKGFRYLGRTTSGTPYVLVTTKKAEKPEDLNGLGFRTSGIYEPIIERAGGKKVKVASPEVYSALQQGLIDVRPAPMATVTANRLYEVLKYWVGPGFFPAGNTVLAMNLKTFNGLPPDLQKVLLDAMEETEHQLVAVKQQEFDAAWAEAKQNGMQRIDWPKEASESFFNDVMDESWRRAAKTLGDELIRKVRPMMSK